MRAKAEITSYFNGDFRTFYGKYGTLDRHLNNGLMLCPFHDDKHPSLSIDAKTGMFHCHGCGKQGDIFTFYAYLNHLDPRADFNKIVSDIAKDFGIVATKPRMVCAYNYTDESGKLLYQNCRFIPKDFRQRRPDGNGGWVWNLNGTKRVPYRLPELLTANEIIVCEGEKDADRLVSLGFVATTSIREGHGQYFASKTAVIIPDNDEAGFKKAQTAAEIVKGHAASIRWLELPDLPEKGDVSDFLDSFDDHGEAAERLALLIEEAGEYKKQEEQEFHFINVADWLDTEPEAPVQILKDTFDAGDKVAIIGSSKRRKTFFLDQMLLCQAAGRPFLSWEVHEPKRVVLIQFEIQHYHKHKRIKSLAVPLGITSRDLGNRFITLNARGLGITGLAGLERLTPEILKMRPDVIAFDPLYKLAVGAENNAEDAKIILSAFDMLAEKTGAAIIYAHHDPKGSPGDRDIRDRGAGSNVIGRDYDACFTLTAHAAEEDAAIVETLLRNYRPQDPIVIQWAENENTGGFCFVERLDLSPEKKTSRTKPAQPDLSTYLPIAKSILNDDEEMNIADFKAALKTRSRLSDHRIRSFMQWATAGGNPYLVTSEERGIGRHLKMVRVNR